MCSDSFFKLFMMPKMKRNRVESSWVEPVACLCALPQVVVRNSTMGWEIWRNPVSGQRGRWTTVHWFKLVLRLKVVRHSGRETGWNLALKVHLFVF